MGYHPGIDHGAELQEKHVMKESTFWKLFCVGLAGFVAVVLCLVWAMELTAEETEYDIIQAIIKDIPAYQAEIESWGYQVTVLPRMEEEPQSCGLKHYYWNHAGPVLILTDQEGGNWCFYYGFDQYFTQYSDTSSMALYESGELTEVNRTVELQIAKRWIGNPPLRGNTKEPGTDGYYDVEVSLEIQAEPIEPGKDLDWFNSHPHNFYCSNNFVESFLGETSFVDMEKKSRNEDRAIKQEVSAKQLLHYYRQGLELQDKLVGLYSEKQRENEWNSVKNLKLDEIRRNEPWRSSALIWAPPTAWPASTGTAGRSSSPMSWGNTRPAAR